MNIDGTDEEGWGSPEEETQAVVETVGRQLKLWRQAAGLRPAEFAAVMGYGENLIYKIERGVRIPRPEYLDKADEALGAAGKIAAMKKDLEQARYPKKVRDLAKLEALAVELGAYSNHNLHGLLQTREYTKALFEMRRPAYSQDQSGAARRSPHGPRVDFRALTGTSAHLRPRRGDSAPSGRRQNGSTSAARTPSGSRAVTERRNPGDADRP